MNTSVQIRLGFESYFDAIKFIYSRGLAWVFLVPLALNLILFFTLFTLVSDLALEAQEQVLEMMGLSGAADGYSGFFSDLLGTVVSVVIKLLFFFLFVIYGGYVIIILLSPFFAWLSEKTEEIVTGHKYPFRLGEFLRDVLRGVLLAVRNLLIESGWMVLLFAASFIPVLGWVAPVALFLISSYFYGFSFIDYTLERKRLSISKSVSFMREHKWVAIANGFIFSLLLAVPIVGSFMASMASVVSVVAGTLAVLKDQGRAV